MSKQYPPLVLSLVDRKPSSFVLKGTENSENPERLDVSSSFILLNHSYNLVPGKKPTDAKVQKITRWLAGCETIYVEEQKEQKLEYNPNRDIIIFEMGTFTVEREGDKVGLYDFLKNYDGNVSNPNRPSGAPPVFIEISTAVEAEQRNANIPDKAKAMATIAALVTTNGNNNGVKTYTYDTDKLLWMCKLFSLSTNDTDEERLDAIMQKADHNPVLFNQMIDDAQSDIKVVIIKAKEIGVILMDGQQAIFAADRAVITSLKGKSMNEKIRELAEFLTSPDGEILNSALRTQVEYAETEALKTK